MRQILLVLTVLFFSGSFGQKHGITGKWKTIDDETGKAISIVEVFESHGKIYGKIIELLNPKDRDKTCTNCDGSDKNKPILGLIVVKGLAKNGEDYNGQILDPKHGKIYKCVVSLEDKDKLKVRGYVGISLFGRTQYWMRMK
jgi:uncharacterized protein (DUF2147 family)